MSDRPAPVHRGIVAGQVAEIIVTLDGRAGRRGSRYRVGPSAVLTAAHVVKGAVSVRVRFDADLPGEWETEVVSCWTDPRSDLAVLTIAPHEAEPPVTVARFGRIGGDQDAVLTARAVGSPRFKLKTYDGRAIDWYRDSEQADGSVAHTIEVIFPARFVSTDVPSPTSPTSPTSSAPKPQVCARRITGTNPAHDTRSDHQNVRASGTHYATIAPTRCPLSMAGGASATPIIPAQKVLPLSRHDRHATFFGVPRLSDRCVIRLQHAATPYVPLERNDGCWCAIDRSKGRN